MGAASVFNAIDTNHDGKISRAEFSNYVMGTTSNYVKPAASIATYSNAVAAPSFQYVQPQAQYARAPAATSITVQPQATSVFNAIDTNHDGKISRSEFSNYVMGTTSNVVQQPAVSSVFNAIDTNYVTAAAPEYANYVQPLQQLTRHPRSCSITERYTE